MRYQQLGGHATIRSLLVLSMLVLVGCNPATSDDAADGHGHPHGHEDGHHHHGGRPDSLHEAVDKLGDIEEAVSAAIQSGDAEAVHGTLHDVAELLEAIPDIAAETDLPKEEWQAVKAASDRLFEAYAVIDKAFHAKDGDKQAAYDEVAGELSEALEEIRTRLPMTGETPPADGHHDHDGHDHDHGDHDHEAEEATSQEGGAES